VSAEFRTSSFCSTGGCVEVGWRTSSFCGTGTCVEVGGEGDGNVMVRDAKDPHRRVTLTFGPGEWQAFLGGIRNGEFQSDRR
jgi:hypothetical protein